MACNKLAKIWKYKFKNESKTTEESVLLYAIHGQSIKQQKNGSLQNVNTKIRERRMRIAGHLRRHNEELASKDLLGQQDRGQINRGRRRDTYIDTLLQNNTWVENTYVGRRLLENKNHEAKVKVKVRMKRSLSTDKIAWLRTNQIHVFVTTYTIYQFITSVEILYIDTFIF